MIWIKEAYANDEHDARVLFKNEICSRCGGKINIVTSDNHIKCKCGFTDYQFGNPSTEAKDK